MGLVARPSQRKASAVIAVALLCLAVGVATYILTALVLGWADPYVKRWIGRRKQQRIKARILSPCCGALIDYENMSDGSPDPYGQAYCTKCFKALFGE